MRLNKLGKGYDPDVMTQTHISTLRCVVNDYGIVTLIINDQSFRMFREGRNQFKRIMDEAFLKAENIESQYSKSELLEIQQSEYD